MTTYAITCDELIAADPVAEAEALDAWLSGLSFTRHPPDERRRTGDGRFLPRRLAAAQG